MGKALIVSGMEETLAESGPYTLFAPNEEAFSELGANVLAALARDPDALTHQLRCHVVTGRHTLSDLVDAEFLDTIGATDLWVSLGEDGNVYIEEARVTRADIETENGVIHIIDLLILRLASETGGVAAV